MAVIRANAEAQAIQIVNDQLSKSPYYISYMYAKSFDGKWPTTLIVNGDGTFPVPVLNIPMDGSAVPTVTPATPAK